jgi:hypothetical protein
MTGKNPSQSQKKKKGQTITAWREEKIGVEMINKQSPSTRGGMGKDRSK